MGEFRIVPFFATCNCYHVTASSYNRFFMVGEHAVDFLA
jgi:hypothetical protein